MFADLIKQIMCSGMTQTQIAQEVHSGQSHISSLLSGKRKIPNWVLGDALIKLHRKCCAPATDQEAA
jgi:predicted XRE-type DNA-binding protein